VNTEQEENMLISEVLKAKGDLVFTAAPTETVGAVAAMLLARKVGALVVVEGERQVVGIVAERDVVRVVAEHGGEGLAKPISECMTKAVIFAESTETVNALLERMTNSRFRHLPICDAGRLVGIVSIGDLVKCKIAEAVAEAEGLRAYIHAA
jgi:CBS domain-containing protein